MRNDITFDDDDVDRALVIAHDNPGLVAHAYELADELRELTDWTTAIVEYYPDLKGRVALTACAIRARVLLAKVGLGYRGAGARRERKQQEREA